MNPDDILRVRDSWAALGDRVPDAMDRFYARLFDAAPDVRSLFPEDMTRQKMALAGKLALVVEGLDKIELLVPAIAQIGRNHRTYGAEPAHYAVVGECLLAALGEVLGADMDDATRNAWATAYGTLADVMIDAAEKDAA